jgi:hypothetical protein
MKKHSLLSILVLCLACAGLAQVKAYAPDTPATTSTKGRTTIRVNALSEVSGPRVRLGEISEISASADIKAKLEQIDLGTAPVAGIPRPVVLARIQSMVIVAGLKIKDVDIQLPMDARIALKVQKVDVAKFVEAAKQAVASSVGPNVLLTNSQTFPDFNAPIGELTFEASKPVKSLNGFSVLVTVFVDGKKVNSRIINLGVDASSAAAIKSGDTVRIYIRSAGATIEVSGRARTGGYTGQAITVVSSTGSIHQGKVLSASEVEVKL